MASLVGQSPLPRIPGCEVAGTVIVAAGGFSAGDRVFGSLFSAGGGGFAEVAALRLDKAAAIPGGTGFAEAAGLVIPGITAYEGLVDEGGCRPGKRCSSPPRRVASAPPRCSWPAPWGPGWSRWPARATTITSAAWAGTGRRLPRPGLCRAAAQRRPGPDTTCSSTGPATRCVTRRPSWSGPAGADLHHRRDSPAARRSRLCLLRREHHDAAAGGHRRTRVQRHAPDAGRGKNCRSSRPARRWSTSVPGILSAGPFCSLGYGLAATAAYSGIGPPAPASGRAATPGR